MARCKLDLTHPKFRIIGGASDSAVQAGLTELRDKVFKDHKLSGFFPQPMKGFPDYQNKIWKWDFAPEADRTSTRKGWRLYAYVADPKTEGPILATAFLCYDRSDGPSGDYPKYLAGVLKKFLTDTIEVVAEEVRFKRQTNVDGSTISLCLECFDTVSISTDISEIETAEGTHECSTSN